jgi:hypothetical protein
LAFPWYTVFKNRRANILFFKFYTRPSTMI